jgi:hypothetical protein
MAGTAATGASVVGDARGAAAIVGVGSSAFAGAVGAPGCEGDTTVSAVLVGGVGVAAGNSGAARDSGRSRLGADGSTFAIAGEGARCSGDDVGNEDASFAELGSVVGARES